MPIYANKSTKEVREKLVEMGCKLYNGGEVFYSGCLLDIKNDFEGSGKLNPKGIYYLCSMRSDGYVQLKTSTGEVLNPIHIKYIIPSQVSKLKD